MSTQAPAKKKAPAKAPAKTTKVAKASTPDEPVDDYLDSHLRNKGIDVTKIRAESITGYHAIRELMSLIVD